MYSVGSWSWQALGAMSVALKLRGGALGLLLGQWRALNSSAHGGQTVMVGATLAAASCLHSLSLTISSCSAVALGVHQGYCVEQVPLRTS